MASGRARQWIRQFSDRNIPVRSASRGRAAGRHMACLSREGLSPSNNDIMYHCNPDCESAPCRSYRILAKGRSFGAVSGRQPHRSEEHTSAPVTNAHLVCRLLLEKKKKQTLVTT